MRLWRGFRSPGRARMRFAGIGFGALLAAMLSTAAAAQTMSYAQAGALIAKSCGKDIERYCSTINVGGGALKDCLTSDQAKVSPKCVADYRTVVASLDKRAAAQA